MPYKVEKWNRPYPPNSARCRLELEAEGYTVHHWSDRPEIVYGLHKHLDEQCHWIISGSLEITVKGGGTFCLEAGDRDRMPAETYHSARVIGDEPVVYLVGSKPHSGDVEAAKVNDFDMLVAFAEMMAAEAEPEAEDTGSEDAEAEP
ncbi:MAG: Cupin domain protein [Acidobacteria bacterium OLB17]|nr:MAG: Cupin domain protein [Acidobacteria bacterium OLB17]MCZ2391136.1 cupin domain-containing protein [Acidobacteriota bacterium]